MALDKLSLRRMERISGSSDSVADGAGSPGIAAAPMAQGILDKIIEALIDVGATYLNIRTNPRSRAARAFVRLYGALVDCQHIYLRWKRIRENTPAESRYLIGSSIGDTQFSEWSEALEELHKAFLKLKVGLGIFAPDTRRLVAS